MNSLQKLLINIKKVLYSGSTAYCPLCDSYLRQFYTFGITPRPNALCPVCGSLERHRMDWEFIKTKTNLFDKTPKKMLHIAPEKAFEALFRSVPSVEYLSGDLCSSTAMVKVDITDIHFQENSFDIIYCSHVLEHVPDDRRGLSELFRVLKPGGWAMIQVPIVADRTYEDLSITSPEERIRVFGHPEHVRNYGLDYNEKLFGAGFQVSIITSNELIGNENLLRYGISENDVIYYCTKKNYKEK